MDGPLLNATKNSHLYVYQFSRNFPTYTFIQSYIYISFSENVPPILLFGIVVYSELQNTFLFQKVFQLALEESDSKDQSQDKQGDLDFDLWWAFITHIFLAGQHTSTNLFILEVKIVNLYKLTLTDGPILSNFFLPTSFFSIFTLKVNMPHCELRS